MKNSYTQVSKSLGCTHSLNFFLDQLIIYAAITVFQASLSLSLSLSLSYKPCIEEFKMLKDRCTGLHNFVQ